MCWDVITNMMETKTSNITLNYAWNVKTHMRNASVETRLTYHCGEHASEKHVALKLATLEDHAQTRDVQSHIGAGTASDKASNVSQGTSETSNPNASLL